MLTPTQRAYALVAHRIQRQLVHAMRNVHHRGDERQKLADLSVCSGLERARNIAARMAWGRRGYRLTLAQARGYLPEGWVLQRVGRRAYKLLKPDGTLAEESHALLVLVNAANSGEL